MTALLEAPKFVHTSSIEGGVNPAFKKSPSIVSAMPLSCLDTSILKFARDNLLSVTLTAFSFLKEVSAAVINKGFIFLPRSVFRWRSEEHTSELQSRLHL